MLICAILLAVVLWFIICASVLRFGHKLKDLSRKEWWQTLSVFFKEYSRRKLFYSFLAAETSLAGGFIPIVTKVWFSCSKYAFLVKISEQPAWLSLVIAVLIAFGFYIYMILSDKKQPKKWGEVIDAALFVNNEFVFTPSKKWFENQNDLAIGALGKRYSPDINFPFDDIEWLLAALRANDGFNGLMWDELDNELESIKRYLRNNEKQLLDKTKKLCNDVFTRINNLNENNNSYFELRESVKVLLEDLEDFSIHRNEQENYGFRSLRQSTIQLANILSKKWIDLKTSKYWIITGEAGMGKSHLIGDIITCRKKNGEPSILLLGEQFNKDIDPIQQIKNKLEIQYRFNDLLERFDLYGQRVGKPVAFFIDAINEGGGDQLWSKYWTELVDRFDRFEYLRLVVSFRISDTRNWFYDLVTQTDKNHVYFHRGFSGKEQCASEFMFRSYGLDQPLWPSYGSEFANPLFLKTYCRLQEKTGEPLQLDSFWGIINKYCQSVNHEVSLKRGYSDSLSLVTDSMHCIADLMIQQGSRWHLEYKIVHDALVKVVDSYKDPKDFLCILIDEGLLRIESYEGHDYVNFAYELIGDYFLADCILEQSGIIDETKWWSFGYGISEAMAVIVPEKKKTEVFELVESELTGDAINAMIDSSGWRDTFTPQGQQLMISFFEEKKYDILFNVILKRPFRTDNTANSTRLYELLWPLKMSERDAVWTTAISENWGLGSDVMDLAEWGMHVSSQALRRINEDVIFRCAETLVWTFTSSWRQLRDTATHALVNILAERKELILPLLKKYHTINDPYVEERLWASVLGALTCCQDKATSVLIAKWVYVQVFQSKQVPENILVRDYAKGILRYAKYLDSSMIVDENTLTIPFTDGTIPMTPTSEQINEKYDNDDWNNLTDEERDVWRAKQAILDSMATEHSTRTSMYGDFGRYIFQSSISAFPVDPEDMSNWAVEMIFEEYGYNPKVFFNFDIRHQSFSRSDKKIERIGKKYQWIALYRILARLSDAYPNTSFEDNFYTPTQSVRNIDPTYRIDTSLNDDRKSKYSVPSYDTSTPKIEIKWIKQWREMPAIENYLLTKDADGVEWVNLFSYNTIKSPKEFSDHDGFVREIWTFIQAFVVRKDQIRVVCKEIHHVGLEGRCFRENREIDGIYAREFYWSDIYKERCSFVDYGFAPLLIGHKEFPKIEISPTYLQYNHSSSEDASSPDGVNILMLNEWIYKGLNLVYGKPNGVWLDRHGTIVAFDNAEYGKGHRALLIRKDILLDFLNKEGLTLFWPVLTERQSRAVHGMGGAGFKQNGGWAYLDEHGVIHHRFRNYEPTKLQKKIGRYKKYIAEHFHGLRNRAIWLLSKYGLKKLSLEEKLRIISETDVTSLHKIKFSKDIEKEEENG